LKHKYLTLIILLFLGILLIVYWIPVNHPFFSQGEIRAAIDIGSESTSLKVAKVDPKTNQILIQLYEKTIFVPYQKHYELSPDQTFDHQVMNQGMLSIKTLKELANSYHVKKIIAVATGAFRKAKNGEQFVKEIEQNTGVQVRILTSNEEGILGFRGALAVTSIQPEHIISWDIGGASMQFTTLTKEGNYVVDKGKSASIPFKDTVIEQIEHKDIKTSHSPNPMTKEEIEAAIRYIASLTQDANQFIRDKIQDPETQILGIGDLFKYGVRPLFNQSIIQQQALEKMVLQMAGKTDAELPGGSFAKVAVTNPLLVLGYMKALRIRQVEVVDTDVANGVLTYPSYWQ
jgi:exopolyphosphatase/guanosine-5'-triphosphate,3'-diphosphate pyrophosphatase